MLLTARDRRPFGDNRRGGRYVGPVIQRNVPVDAYIIGAGPGGLATAAALGARGLHGVVLERSNGVGTSWRGHYDRLHLHTPRELSGLPGFPIPREMGRWVSRDDVVRYLELYAAHHRLDVRLGTEVRRIDRSADGDSWTLTLADGTTLTAPYAVVATGFNHTPREPDVPGLQGYSGDVVMARAYRNGAGHAGKDVLVVGTGNTGTELAVDLVEHGAARVRLAVRTVPHILRRNTGPYAAQYTGIAVRHLPTALVDRVAPVVERIQTPDLSAQGMPRPDTGLLTRVERDNAIPVQDVGIIDAHDDKGRPVERGGRTPRGAKGLWFTGYTNPISGMLREISIDARKIALAMALRKRQEIKALRRQAA